MLYALTSSHALALAPPLGPLRRHGEEQEREKKEEEER